MPRASDYLTSPDTVALGSSALGVEPLTAEPRSAFHPLERATYAEPGPDPVVVDAQAETGVDDLLAVCALKRAATRALTRTRDHLGGGMIGMTAALALMFQLEADPAMDDVLDDLAARLLSSIGDMVGATPSTPSPDTLASARLAEVLDADDGTLLDLSDKARRRAVELELLPIAEAA